MDLSHQKESTSRSISVDLTNGLAFLVFLIVVVNMLSISENKDISIYLISILLTMTWIPISLSIWEKKMINRRILINQVLNPNGSIYPIVKGGLIISLMSLASGFIPSFFILLTILHLHIYEWAILLAIFTLKVICSYRIEKRIKRHLIGSLTPYISRNISGLILIVISACGLGTVHFYVPPHVDVSGGLIGVFQLAEDTLTAWDGHFLYPFLQISVYIDHLYLWALSDQILSARLDEIGRCVLLTFFAIHNIFFIVLMQGIFNGLIILLNFKDYKNKIDELDISQKDIYQGDVK